MRTQALMLLAAAAFALLVYLNADLIDNDTIGEGQAKAQMIKELTGLDIEPEIARYANITFSGTTVSINTDSLNVWLGKNWQTKK